jgi:hypothetical protein
MTDIELILTMLGEATTTTLHRDRDSHGMQPLRRYAKDGGGVAGRTSKDIERQTGKSVISRDNFKQLGRRDGREHLNRPEDPSLPRPPWFLSSFVFGEAPSQCGRTRQPAIDHLRSAPT